MDNTFTVHMIGSAHIDPVWLWKWDAGVVEVLSTCRSAARLLDRHPDFIFTRSDVWVHEIVERYDPALFERIRAFAAEGRWYPAGGWYIQPDCNLPLAASFRKHIELGKSYFPGKLGITVDVGFNVDSFGHNASLPDLLAEGGYDSYVMMRPMGHEKALPANLFRWRGAGGAEVTVWRIQKSYNAETIEAIEANIEAALAAAPEGVSDVMCFYGVGDHGGGPTEELIEWIEAHVTYRDNVRLEFSHPRKFFDAVRPNIPDLPIVEGELQMHAIGCYTVVADIKRGVRRAEHSLVRAERALAALASGTKDESTRRLLEHAWKSTLFNEFHDTLGGSSIREAYRDSSDQLGESCAIADRITTGACFDSLVRLEPDPLQRIVAFSFTSRPQTAYVVHEPWIHPNGFSQIYAGSLLDADSRQIDYQIVQQSAILGSPRAMLFETELEPGKPGMYRLDPSRPRPPVETDIMPACEGLENSVLALSPAHRGRTGIAGVTSETLSLPESLCSFAVLDDPSDTWSHRIEGYDGDERGRFTVVESELEESGPLRGTLRTVAAFGSSRLTARVHMFRRSGVIEIDVEVQWSERAAILKCIIPGIAPGEDRLDGITDGVLLRKQDGKEYPFIDWTLPQSGVGVVCPECFGFDGRDGSIRLSLLRAPVFAWHDPTKLGTPEAYRYTDQGVHRFRICLVPGLDRDNAAAVLSGRAQGYHNPPMIFDWTAGMENG